MNERHASPTPAVAGVRDRRGEKTVVAVTMTHDALRDEATARGWRLFYLPFCGLHIPEELVLKGALMGCPPGQDWLDKLRARGCPIVFLQDCPCHDKELLPAVLPDIVAEGRMAADHFAERSFRHVAYFGRNPWDSGQAIYEAFRERAEALDLECHLFRSRKGPRESREERTVRRQREFADWVQAIPKPVGLLAPGDGIAASFCSWVSLAGLDVPRDVAILTRGHLRGLCETMVPSLSSFEGEEDARIHAACDVLERMMAGHDVSRESILVKPKRIVERESTNVLAVPDRDVASALRYMWDHLDLELTVVDVAREVKLSSRQLARKFRLTLGRTFCEELRRKRIDDVKRLLRTTDMPLTAIAPMTGFKSTSYLHRAFRRACDMTPAAYRKEQKTLRP